MLQMTSLELSELVETEMTTNPLLEEVMPGDEVEEISSHILDQNSDGHDVDAQAEVSANTEPNTISEEEYLNYESYSASEPETNGSEPSADTFGDDEPRRRTSKPRSV